MGVLCISVQFIWRIPDWLPVCVFLYNYFQEFSNCTRTFSCIWTLSTWPSSSLDSRKRYPALSCSIASDRSECRSARAPSARCSQGARTRRSERDSADATTTSAVEYALHIMTFETLQVFGQMLTCDMLFEMWDCFQFEVIVIQSVSFFFWCFVLSDKKRLFPVLIEFSLSKINVFLIISTKRCCTRCHRSHCILFEHQICLI